MRGLGGENYDIFSKNRLKEKKLTYRLINVLNHLSRMLPRSHSAGLPRQHLIKPLAGRRAHRLRFAQHLARAHERAGSVLAAHKARHGGSAKRGCCREGRAGDF